MQMNTRMIDERLRRDPGVTSVQQYIDRLKRGGDPERVQVGLVYTIAALLWRQGAWQGLTRAGMRQVLGRTLDRVDRDIVAEGWAAFISAHGMSLPK